MKKSILFLAISITLSTLNAQVSENFELWVTDPLGFHLPSGWTANNATPNRPVTMRNEVPYDGT